MPAETLEQLILNQVTEWKELIINDFEDFAFKKHPLIREIKEGLYKSGAIFSLMSGSGSSVYGIFNGKPILPEALRRYVIFEGRCDLHEVSPLLKESPREWLIGGF